VPSFVPNDSLKILAKDAAKTRLEFDIFKACLACGLDPIVLESADQLLTWQPSSDSVDVYEQYLKKLLDVYRTLV